jgi:hypothetical protein
MAFTPGFEYDIFISYTHRDNVPVVSGRPGWVDNFHESLENWLIKRRGLDRLSIWRAEGDLDGNTEFNVSIENKIKGAALFLVLHSRNYPKSAYCRKELEWFVHHNSERPGGLMVGERLRILNVMLNNIPHSEWPQELGNTLGFPMHDAQDEADLGEFTLPETELFQKQLRGVVDAIELTLSDFAETSAATMQAPTTQADTGIQVFLADVPDSLQMFRERLIAEIGTHATVLDDIPPPLEREMHAERVAETLARSSLSIHLLDAWPGRRLSDDRTTTYPRVQAEIALSDPTPSLLWVPENLDPGECEDDRQGQWLAELENGDRTGTHYEWVRSSRPAFIELVLQRIQALKIQAPPESQVPYFLIDTHQKDQRYAYKLADLLAERGADVDFNKESRDPTESLRDFERAVQDVQNLIIMFGGVSGSWVAGRIKTAVKVVAERLQADVSLPLERIWVYCLGQGKDAEQIRRVPLIQVSMLDNRESEGLDSRVVDQLLAGSPEDTRP